MVDIVSDFIKWPITHCAIHTMVQPVSWGLPSVLHRDHYFDGLANRKAPDPALANENVCPQLPLCVVSSFLEGLVGNFGGPNGGFAGSYASLSGASSFPERLDEIPKGKNPNRQLSERHEKRVLRPVSSPNLRSGTSVLTFLFFLFCFIASSFFCSVYLYRFVEHGAKSRPVGDYFGLISGAAMILAFYLILGSGP
ncbi:hypothetical protein [Rhodopseudomonas palustris]